MREAARRPQTLHDLFERQVLMILRFHHAGLDALQQRHHIRLARRIDTHGQGIDEQPDQAFDFGKTAVGNRHADDHLLLSGQPRQQYGPCAHEQHERCHRLRLAEGSDIGAQTRIEIQRDAGPGVILMRRTWAVSGQGQQYRRTRQGLLPVIGLMTQSLVVQPVALPYGVIAILQRQCGQRVLLPLTECLVERGQFAGQHAQRPTVGNDVMHGQQQDVTVFSQTQQTATDRQVVLQVEGLRGLFPDHGLQRLWVLIT